MGFRRHIIATSLPAICLILLSCPLANAADRSAPAELQPSESFFSNSPVFDKDRPRGLFWGPMGSFLFPSLDQWWEGQRGPAAAYLVIAGGGLAIMQSGLDDNGNPPADRTDLDEADDRLRRIIYGAQLYQVAGELSAFHAFRTAVESRRASGEFNFIEAQETTADLLLAPFDFSQLLKPTTFVPLGLIVWAGSSLAGDELGRLTFSDGAFTAGVSYNAGVGEEAFFRGYMQPALRHAFNSDFWSIATTGAIFGAAHLSPTNQAPVAQTIAGWYLGWLTQRNGWSLKQAIFLHTWWDVFAIGFSIAHSKGDAAAFVRLPPLTFEF